MIDSSIIIKIESGTEESTGGGIAVSPNKAVTALHGMYEEGQEVTVIDRHGKRMGGTVRFMRYAADEVDIAVVTLNGSAQFTEFIPYSSTPVSLLQKLSIVGLKADRYGEYNPYYSSVEVHYIEPYTSLFQATYYSQDGMSGCGIVSVLRGTQHFVVGVLVASHDKTAAITTPAIDEEERPKKKAKRGEVSLAKQVAALKKSHRDLAKDQLTIDSNIHGHHAYNLICEIARVDGLIEFLSE
jgi:hypothetical protein